VLDLSALARLALDLSALARIAPASSAQEHRTSSVPVRLASLALERLASLVQARLASLALERLASLVQARLASSAQEPLASLVLERLALRLAHRPDLQLDHPQDHPDPNSSARRRDPARALRLARRRDPDPVLNWDPALERRALPLHSV
jgi:hypothetical protein